MGGSQSRNKHHEMNIDFEGARPGDGERKVFDAASQIMQQGPEVLRKIDEYEGCQELARMAMSNPSLENEKAAFDGLLWAVDSIAHFHDFAQALEKTIPELLNQLATQSPMKGDKEVQQAALYKQLGEVFNFALQFDQTRMMRPHLSNDFSYYRRLLPKFNKHPDVRVKDDEASGMALFTAEHIPMTKCLAKGAEDSFNRNEAVGTVLSVLANSCLSMLRSGKFSDPNTELFCARAMTGALVLFDHVHPQGVFFKRSPIPAGSVIQMLQSKFPNDQALLNAIRFSTKNFKSAPNSVQNLFD